MATWQQIRLGEISQIYSGFAFRSQDLGEHGIPVVKIGNIQNKRVSPECADHLPEELCIEKLNRYFLQKGDTLIAMTGAGSVGKVGKMPRVDGRFLVNQRVAIVRPDDSRCDSAFVYFALSQDVYETKLYALGLGAGQPNVSAKEIGDLEIPFPPLPVQRRIAGILSAYDELMENSQRRIRILESMARALYREWFVHYRFPGHENHSRVASPLGDIPQGWEVKRLDSLCRSVQDGDWIETKDQGGEDYRLLQISNVGVGEFIETGNFRFVTQATFERLRCTEIKPGDILVARMPTPIGRAWMATEMPWRMITAVDVAIIRAQSAVLHPLFLAQAWNEPFNLRRIAGQASGTTRLRITRRELAALDFIVPPIEIQLLFAKVVEPQIEMVKALRHQIQNLRRTRDLLLPRLLSGHLELKPAQEISP